MRKQDHLIQLIHSLTPSEKKYFRQYISARHDSKDYEKLFDTLHKSDTYDADTVSRTLKKSKKNLADDKEYLQEILLRSLQNFHASSMPRARCFNGLIEADILAGKGMTEFGLARVRKLKKSLIAGEDSLQYYMVLAQETNMAKYNTPGGLKAEKAIKATGDELIERLKAILLYNQVVKISIQILDLSADTTYVANPTIQKKAAVLIQEVNELTRGKKLSACTHTAYHKMLAEYYLFLGVDTAMSIQHGRKALQRFEAESTAYRQFYIKDNYLIYQILVQGYFASRDYKNMELFLHRIKALISGNVLKQLQYRSGRFIFQNELLFFTATGRHTEALAYLQNNLDGYKTIGATEEDLSVVQLMQAVNLFHQQKYDDALKALLPLLSSGAPPQLPETSITARTLNLMIQYEIGNTESMPDYLRASERFFRKEKLVTKEVKLFLELMHQLCKYGNKVHAMEFQKRLEDVYAACRFELIGHFVLLPWLRRFPKRTLA
ncbi:MAG: hypothetical protein JWO03_3708 [Bacteroidetes bacterium]|nr:hypothetical protein [Bacteroidota bacterium]